MNTHKTIVVTENPNIMTGLHPEDTYQEISPQEYAILKAQEEQRLEREKRDSPYRVWAQLNLDSDVIEHLHTLASNKTAMNIFLFIVEHMDGRNALLASYKVFQEALGLSRASIQRGIRYLAEHNYIYIKKSGLANVYLLNPQLAWKSWGSNYKYCEFPANVLLAKSEQPEQPQDNQKKPLIKDKKLKTVEVNEFN